MAGKGILSPQSNKLLEETIDGASLIYDSIEAHNCEQLKRWLKYHGRPQKEKKNELIERLGSKGHINSVSHIDRAARVLFPASFAVLNLFYWLVYAFSNESFVWSDAPINTLSH
ncbi:Gamma-aminobutyric acid receptor alpha-like [Eumeta japonica]|uniref:Gamma-aminobutyric acid receptor alpha-like n=1 Tax=Eumeta variegata TaxID=151549 RepID=A0A4C1TSP2_EUMVA|nr:Gamma-aminobutyric acid receptor alpha-like [Eumeta japonica]